jgi:hypothetical protein
VSQHVEWMDAKDCFMQFATSGDFEDSHGTKNERPVLVLGFDDLIAVEGTKEELLTMLSRAQQLIVDNF